jgi:hypothetical protein
LCLASCIQKIGYGEENQFMNDEERLKIVIGQMLEYNRILVRD